MIDKTIEFKNGSHIKILESKETQRPDMKVYPISLVDFVENFLEIKLLPYQKAYLEVYEKIPNGTKFMFARGQSHMRFIYAMMYKTMWKKYIKELQMRTDKINYYLNIAKEVAKQGTCLRTNYGAVIVKDDEIISTGYTGSPRGRVNCCDIGTCKRMELNIPSGERYELCRSVHAEMNAIISAERSKMIGSSLYLVGMKPDNTYKEGADCCSMCKRMIINAGIDTVYIRDTEENFRVIPVASWVRYDDSLMN